MTAEMLQDAIGLLPSDLIAETDKKRCAKPRVILWKRYAAMAACFAVILSCSLFAARLFDPKGATDAVAEAPAAAAPMDVPTDAKLVIEEAAPEAPAAQAPSQRETADDAADSSNSLPQNSTAATGALHHHSAAQEAQTRDDPVEVWCGNTVAWLYIDGTEYAFSGSDAVALSSILVNLRYDPEKLCRCMAEFTADTENMTGFEINLAKAFVRYDNAQADLTEEQAAILREIIESVTG